MTAMSNKDNTKFKKKLFVLFFITYFMLLSLFTCNAAAPTCLSSSRSPWIRKVLRPSSSDGSSLHTPTLLRQPSCGNQPQSSLVITTALTRTM